MRAARGSPLPRFPPPWKSVGSDTGAGMRDAGCVETAPARTNRVALPPPAQDMFTDVRKLEHLDAWRCAQELAYQAYLLTLSPQLSKHFALIDQIRRAALSVPANIAEGYALGTTPQFLRGLKIALGSNTELYSHLAVLARLDLLPTDDVHTVIDLCNRVIAMTIGLIRNLSHRRS
ncbi:MAG: four helix bundle protein [Chloroflexi bacterium]|nr:MAG: four helix bundle protein [Chloroflexota bacterium]